MKFVSPYLLVPLLVLPGLMAVGADSSAPTPSSPTPPTAQPAPSSVDAKKKHPANRLAKEKSPYLIQHAHNPVDWFPWGDEAFEKARKENKPILLSIGYSTCHWCHVMERESFESEEIAKILNEKFVAIKLDREERPDVDNIYMTAMQALELGSGWPLNVFMTPDRKPFYGGTYFRQPVFKKLLDQIAEKWTTDKAALEKDATNIAKGLAEMLEKTAVEHGNLKKEWISKTAKELAADYDPKFGGFSKAPKFPQPQVPGLILLEAVATKKKEPVEQVLTSLRRMAAGGIYDHVGGGFARYSVDEKWLVPHFEKMLYDNAQLVHLYLDAHLHSKDPQFGAVARDILNYILRDMTHVDGGFYSAEDAGSEGYEGKFYVWTKAELKAALPDAADLEFVEKHFTVTEKGNFEDHSHPNPLKNQNILAMKDPDKKWDAETAKRWGSIREKLLTARSKRIRPHLDDKILSSWNGLMLSAMARAAVVLEEPKYLDAARKNLAFTKAKLWDSGSKTLYHRWRDGERDSTQLLVAYASTLGGVVDLYQSTLDPAVLDFAVEVADAMVQRFFDEKAGGFYTSASQDDLLFKVKDDYDGAEPSGNSQAIYGLLKLAAITGNTSYKSKAEKSLQLFAGKLETLGQAVPLMTQALHFLLQEPYHVVIVGDPADAGTQKLIRAAHQVYQPGKVVLGTAGKVEEFAKSQPLQNGKPTAYVCTGGACKLPTNDATKVGPLLLE